MNGPRRLDGALKELLQSVSQAVETYILRLMIGESSMLLIGFAGLDRWLARREQDYRIGLLDFGQRGNA